MADNDNKLDDRVTSLERQVAVIVTKVDNLIRELQDFKAEMRADRARQDADIKEIRAQQNADMKEIREILNNNVRNMFITVIIGVGAMVVAVMMK